MTLSYISVDFIGRVPPSECYHCMATFVHADAVEEHIKQVHSETSPRFECNEQSCNASYPNIILLETHQSIHDQKFSATNNSPDSERLVSKIIWYFLSFFF